MNVYLRGLAMACCFSAVLSMMLVGAAQINHQNDPSACIELKNVTSTGEVVYTSNICPNGIITIKAQNKLGAEIQTGFAVSVDRYDVINEDFSMKQNSTRQFTANVSKHVKPGQTNHTVTVSTFGDHTTYNFTQKVNNTDSGPVPTPEITDVEVKTATIDGEETTVVNATVTNPTIHPYPMVLLASTENTSTFQLASTGPNDSSVVQIPLDEEPGTTVEGELRLNDGNVSEGYDQVQFNGSAHGTTTHQNESYTVVQASWEEDPYQYGEDEQSSDDILPSEPLESPGLIAALGGGIVVMGLATRRLV